MWKSKLNKVSRSILSDYPHDFVNLSCKQFKPNQDLEYGLPVPNDKSVFFMIKPNSNTLGFYVLSDESYYSSLSQIGDVEDSGFSFSEITNKSLFLAVHKDGHFYQKINIGDVVKEISTYAHLNNSTFLLQLNSVDLNLSRLHSKISNKLSNIRKPKTVKRESDNYTEPHKEKNRDLDNLGDDILKSLSSGICSSAIIWCFSAKSPNIGFVGSKASVSWVSVDSDVISQNVSISNKFKRLFKKSEYSRASDIFKSKPLEITQLQKDKQDKFWYEYCLSIYNKMRVHNLGSRHNPPKLGDRPILRGVVSRGISCIDDYEKSYNNPNNTEGSVPRYDGAFMGFPSDNNYNYTSDIIDNSKYFLYRDNPLKDYDYDSKLMCFDVLRLLQKETARYLYNRKNSPVFFFDGDVTLHQKNIESSKTVDSDNLVKSESFEDMGY